MITDLLSKYKEITKTIIKEIENEKIVVELMEEREDILKILFIPENNREEIKKMYLEMDLLALDEELKRKIDKEILLVKEKIKNLHNIKSANNAYEKNIRQNNFLNIKI